MWEKVPRKGRELLKEFQSIFSPTSNYKNYRDLLAACNPPGIPYLGVISKDITAIEEKSTLLQDGTLSFNKMRDLWKAVRILLEFQSVKYKKIEVETDLCLALKSPRVMTEQELFQLIEVQSSKRKARIVTETAQNNNDNDSSDLESNSSTSSFDSARRNSGSKPSPAERKLSIPDDEFKPTRQGSAEEIDGIKDSEKKKSLKRNTDKSPKRLGKPSVMGLFLGNNDKKELALEKTK